MLVRNSVLLTTVTKDVLDHDNHLHIVELHNTGPTTVMTLAAFVAVCSGVIGKPIQQQMVILGRFRHYKGKEYTVLGIAQHSETQEELVVYRQEYGDHGLWVRPCFVLRILDWAS